MLLQTVRRSWAWPRASPGSRSAGDTFLATLGMCVNDCENTADFGVTNTHECVGQLTNTEYLRREDWLVQRGLVRVWEFQREAPSSEMSACGRPSGTDPRVFWLRSVCTPPPRLLLRRQRRTLPRLSHIGVVPPFEHVWHLCLSYQAL